MSNLNLPSKKLEKILFGKGYSAILGVDEVGMGCLAGPVVVCAVCLGPEFHAKSHLALAKLRDSKLLLPHQREVYARELIKNRHFKFAICYCQPVTIDKINIYQAARQAMRRAVTKHATCNVKYGQHNASCSKFHIADAVVLVDGPHKISGLNMDQIPVVKGDSKVFAIACASIIAKVYRDKMMVRYAARYPGYGFETHKGYGTALHRTRLAALGPCPIHRRSFKLKHET